MSDSRFNKRAVATQSADYFMSLSQIDMDALRREFAALIDRLADQIFAAGLDFDDVDVERIIVLIVGATEIEVVAEFLSDEALLRKSIEEQLYKLGCAESRSDLSIKQLRVRALSDRPA